MPDGCSARAARRSAGRAPATGAPAYDTSSRSRSRMVTRPSIGITTDRQVRGDQTRAKMASLPTLRSPGAIVKSTMQDVQLTIGSLRRHGTTVHADAEVVTATADGVRSRSFAELGRRAAQLAHG